MRYLILSDIHANLEALESTLAAGGECDAVLVLGDLVGYGADPNTVIERIQSLPNATIVRGNHDKVGAGVETVDSFNHLARHAISWTSTELTPEHRQWLAAMPAGPAIIDEIVEICHGSPFDEDAYIFDDLDARRAVVSSQRQVCFYGHTHVPAIFRYDGELTSLGPPRGARHQLTLEPKAKYLINCGAVGQPRDGDPRAACGMFDTASRTVTVLRVAYDVARAQAKIIAAGLPEVLAQRLAIGR